VRPRSPGLVDAQTNPIGNTLNVESVGESLMKSFFGLGCIALCSPFVVATASHAAEWRSVSPTDERIVAVYVVDGKSHPETLGNGGDGRVEAVPLDVTKASLPGSYTITSPDDPNYQKARRPVQIGRKSKGREFVNDHGKYPYVLEHWLYLVLPQPMRRGKTYHISSPLFPKKLSLRFDERNTRSETIHVNQWASPPRLSRSSPTCPRGWGIKAL
jgi:hypothetical protein